MNTYNTKAAQDFCKAFGINPNDALSFSYSAEEGVQFVIVPSVVKKDTQRLIQMESRILTAADMALEIDPDDVDTIDWSLPVEVIDEGNGKRRTGRKSLHLDITFKDKGPKWVENK